MEVLGPRRWGVVVDASPLPPRCEDCDEPLHPVTVHGLDRWAAPDGTVGCGLRSHAPAVEARR